MRSALQSNAANTCCRHHDGPVMFLHTFRRKNFDWLPVDHAIEFMDEISARQWSDLVQSLLYSLPERPLHLFVVVNPFGGSQKADAVWQDIVKPIFERAHITCDAFRTGYRDHAVELLQQMPLDQFQGYNGIVAVGGDGLFQECLRGLLALRSRGGAWQSKASTIRIGQVPAGSTDAVACTINGCRSAVTAALHVVLGDRAKLDVLEVRTKEGQCRYACSTASYGFVGDVLGASERMRWMGPARYDVSGVMTFMRLRSYAVRLWYKLPLAPHPVKAVCCAECQLCSEPVSNVFDVVGSLIGVTDLGKSSNERNTCGCNGSLRSQTANMKDLNSRHGSVLSSEACTASVHCVPASGRRPVHMRGASGFGEQMLLQQDQSCNECIGGVAADGECVLHDLAPPPLGDSCVNSMHERTARSCVDDDRWHCWEGEVSSLMIVVTPTRSDKSKHGIVPPCSSVRWAIALGYSSEVH